MDHETIAKRHRDQAEEFRAKPGVMTDEATRASYLALAAAYEGLADNEEKLEFKGHGLRSPAERRPPSPK